MGGLRVDITIPATVSSTERAATADTSRSRSDGDTVDRGHGSLLERVEREQTIAERLDRRLSRGCELLAVDDAEDSQAVVATVHLDADTSLGTLLDELRSEFDDVTVEQAVPAEDPEYVPVDRGRLTARQQEVLTTAREMGYFSYPRDANATEVAEALDICVSTLAEHLAAAQSKVFDDLFVDDADEAERQVETAVEPAEQTGVAIEGD